MPNRLSFDRLIGGQSLEQPVCDPALEALGGGQQGAAAVDAVAGALHCLDQLTERDVIQALPACQESCFIDYICQLSAGEAACSSTSESVGCS